MQLQDGCNLSCFNHARACRHANERSYGSQKRGGDGNILGFLNVRGLQHFIRLRKFVPINDQLSAELGVDLNVKNQSYFPQAALTYQARHPDQAAAWEDKSIPTGPFRCSSVWSPLVLTSSE